MKFLQIMCRAIKRGINIIHTHSVLKNSNEVYIYLSNVKICFLLTTIMRQRLI